MSKKIYKKYDSTNMVKAINMIRGGMVYNKDSILNNIPIITLKRKVKNECCDYENIY